MENKYLGRAIGQEEETEVIMTGESVIEGYKKLMKMVENAEQAKRTNFEAITESPEKLAEFLRSVKGYCDYIHNCKQCSTGCKNGGWLGWLREEYKEL